MTDVVIKNKTGLHARPASSFVHLAKTHKANIQVIKNGKAYDGKSIMSIMMAMIVEGDRIQIHVEGENAASVEKEMVAFVEALQE